MHSLVKSREESDRFQLLNGEWGSPCLLYTSEITLVETNSMVYGLIKAVLRLKSNRLAF